MVGKPKLCARVRVCVDKKDDAAGKQKATPGRAGGRGEPGRAQRTGCFPLYIYQFGLHNIES